MLGVGENERDEIAAADARVAQRACDRQRGDTQIGVRSRVVRLAGDEHIAGFGARGIGQRLRERPQRGHQAVVR